jgi:hypothetical protein
LGFIKNKIIAVPAAANIQAIDVVIQYWANQPLQQMSLPSPPSPQVVPLFKFIAQLAAHLLDESTRLT